MPPDPSEKLPPGLQGDGLAELHPSKGSERTASIDISVDVVTDPSAHGSPDGYLEEGGYSSGGRSSGSRGRTGPSHSGPSHSGPSHSGPSHSGPSYSGPSHSGPSHSGPSRSAAGRPSSGVRLQRSSQSGQRSLRTGPGRAVRTGPRRPRSRSGIGLRGGDTTDPNIGRILGSYKLQSLIGSGGMGQVYSAEHVILGRRVALKLLRPEYAVKRDAVHRFFQEARAVNTIGHENIVDITDFVELDTGETFFIMELLQGSDLAGLLRGAKRPLPLHQAMQIAMQVCDGLEAAHAANIVHRDLKPDNIFVLETKKPNFVKILDFGVAKLQGHDVNNSWQTAAGSVIGTPAYMSPEQASSIPVDNRSDIYSLGAILYELFTGHPVFRAKSFGEYVVKHMNDMPVPPRELPNAPKIPLALERVILKCLEKDPKDRYQSVEALRDDLARATATVETSVKLAPVRANGHKRLVALAVVGVGLISLATAAFLLAAGIGGDGPPPARIVAAAPHKTPPPPEPRSRTAPVAAAAKPQPRVTPIPQRTAQVTLRTDPPGAQVFKGGKRALGVTPIDVTENVGDIVEYSFRLAGFKRAAETLEILGEDTVVRVALEKLTRSEQRVRRPKRRPKRVKRRRRRPSSTRKPPRSKRSDSRIRPGEQVDPFNN